MARTKGRKRSVKGEPWVWLSGGAVATGVVMIAGLVLLIAVEGTVAFWPGDIEAFVLGDARYHVQHEERGQAWITNDDARVLFMDDSAYRALDGQPFTGDPAEMRVATVADYAAVPGPFDARDVKWLVRGPDDETLISRGEKVTPRMLVQEPSRFLFEMGEENRRFLYGITTDLPADGELADEVSDAFFGKLKVEHPNLGPVYMNGGELYAAVGWRYEDGPPVELGGVESRRATIADFREFRDLFDGAGPWMLADDGGSALLGDADRPVSPREYLENPGDFPSPWGYYNEDGERVTLESLLGDDRWRDYRVLVGATRGERAMDVRQLPPNLDGTPVKSYELDVEPTEHLVRQGNQGEGLYASDRYFQWVREGLPDLETARRAAPGTYNETVLVRAPMPGAVQIERLEHGVLTGYVTSVSAGDEVIADIEEDGRERVWEVFLEEQRKMREAYLERYQIEKDDLGDVQFEIKEREDELAELRYENRDNREVVSALDALEAAFEEWQVGEPMDHEFEEADAHGRAREAWLKDFAPALEEWREAEAAAIEGDGGRVLERAAELQTQRARIRAEDFAALRFQVSRMRQAESVNTYTLETADGRTTVLALAHVVRAFRPNELGLFGKLGVHLDRVWEFLTDDPREANSEGGIWPVIIGTLVMVLLMTVAVVPLGVVAALYLREYARQGPVVSTVRIAVNNLAGVPSIVFGIFGLGFFCIMVGGSIDDLFYPERLPAPTFGGGGILWAALTLALLTVPVVVVATEEALSAVPSSQREASLACGASKFQTVRKVVLPQALPGVLTGTILAMARGAGEVAPLMLVGAVKYAPYLPVDGTTPFVHLERKFMHLGFHIYDVGFQSPNVDNTRPLVFATALTLIGLVAVLNIFAIAMRNRLRRKLSTSSV